VIVIIGASWVRLLARPINPVFSFYLASFYRLAARKNAHPYSNKGQVHMAIPSWHASDPGDAVGSQVLVLLSFSLSVAGPGLVL
jgi:hypothetical protein